MSTAGIAGRAPPTIQVRCRARLRSRLVCEAAEGHIASPRSPIATTLSYAEGGASISRPALLVAGAGFEPATSGL